MRRVFFFVVTLGLTLAGGSAPHLLSRPSGTADFVHFESDHVHPMALTPSGERLLVVNTPDARLAVFDLTGQAPARLAEVPVGLEPVSVAALDDSTAWVVNRLSDDVSVVNLNTFHVRASLSVGDEPSDVVFAGTPLRAYVSVSEEDAVKVYDPATLAQSATIAINGAYPRTLACNAPGTRVFVTVLHAGNRTSVLSEAEALGNLPPPSPPMAGGLPPAPQVGLIIQEQSGVWRDESGQDWSATAQYNLHEVDLAEISTSSSTVVREVGDLGTANFGLAADPTSGSVAVTSTEARNLVRFEPNLRGHNVDTRIALVPASGGATVLNLNPHVNYGVTPGLQSERDSALGIPNAVAYSGDGQRVFVTSLTSDRLGVIDAGSGAILARVPSVAGPTGVLVDTPRGRVYVLGRFRSQLQTLSLVDFSEVARTGIGFDPTPDVIVHGRRFFYGGGTSGHGEHACATCHVFGDFDNIVWDLGDPQGSMQPVDTTGMLDPFIDHEVHPMKGPMATQSLRGLLGTGGLHWRSDRADVPAFNGAFVSLLGRGSALPDSQMMALTDFIMALAYPPNPFQYLDRTMRDAPPGSPSAKRGETFFMGTPVDGGLTCNACHTATGFGPGTNGQIINNVALQESQDMKIPQLRNMYKKTGFTDSPGALNKRGFGFTHDGAIDNLFNFLKFPGFSFANDDQRRDVEAFLLSFDTGMAPAVGRRLTFDGTNNGSTPQIARLDTLIAQAELGHCDLIARGRVAGQPRGWRHSGSDVWSSDKVGEPVVSTLTLRNSAGAGSEVTFMGVPPGSGTRMGVDRDRDGYLDGDELDAGSDPGDPASTPTQVAVDPPPPMGAFAMLGVSPNPFRHEAEIRFTLGRRGVAAVSVFDVMGRKLRVLSPDRVFEAGEHRLHWDGMTSTGRAAQPGMYFVRIETEAGAWSKTLVRVR